MMQNMVIKKIADCSIRVFMRCLFEEDYTGVENFSTIWTQYVDMSGLARTREKDLLTAIHNIEVRLVVVPEMIAFQKKYILEFAKPYTDGFWFFKNFAHRLKWDSEMHIEDFMLQLDRVRSKELKFESQLDILNKEHKDLQKEGVRVDGNGRKEFIKLLNAISKYRHTEINRDTTDMESFAYMVNEYFESNQEK